MSSRMMKVFLLLPPSSRYQGLAESAVPVFKIILPYKVTFPLYQDLVAVVAIGMGAFMPGHITQVNISNTFLKCQFSQLFKRRNGRGRKSGQLIPWRKSQKMQGVVWPHFLQDPPAHPPDHLRLIHIRGHHKGGHLKPDALCVHGLERV